MMTAPPNDFETFFDLVYPQAEKVARRITGSHEVAEDLAAEALSRAYANWRRVSRHPRPEAWVLRTTINLSIDRSRKRGRFHEHRQELATPTQTTVEHADQVAIRLALGEALHRLHKRQRHVVALRYLADMSEADVAATFDISAGSVKTHLHRALKKLRIDLKPKASHVEPA